MIERLGQARIVQALIVYAGASWIVLQLVGTLNDLLDLPDWLGPVTVVLLGIGLVVVAATAWVQSLESTTKAEEAGELPTDWEVDAADVLASLKAGKLPHLTWGRAIVGGVVALSLAIGAAGAFVLVTGGSSLIGPTPAAADAPRTGVVVLPFQTRSDDLAVYGEGMVDLLTSNLDGLGGLRTVDAGTVIARWKSEIGEDFTVELDRALEVAGGLDARYALRGTVVPIGEAVRISVDIFDLDTRDRVENTQVEGPPEGMVGLVEGLSVDLARIFVGRTADLVDRTEVSTRSLPAMEAYLRGETLYRAGRFGEAVTAFDEAVAADSLFALAYMRLADAWGWIPSGLASAAIVAASDRATALADRLPPRARLLARADAGMGQGSLEIFAELEAYVASNPDDAEALNLLAEYQIHVPWIAMPEPGEMTETFERVIELVPTFSPYYTHLIYLAIDRDDRADFDRLVRAYRDAGADSTMVTAAESVWDFYRGTSDERGAAEEYLRAGTSAQVANFGMAIGNSDDLAARHALASSMRPDDVAPAAVFPPSIAGIWAGRGPDGWGDAPDGRPYGWFWWSALVGPPSEMPDELLQRLSSNPTPGDAASIALLAAMIGDRSIVDEAVAAFAEMDLDERALFAGLHFGAGAVEELRNSVTAVEALRSGEPERAIDAARASLELETIDSVTRLLLGDALAAAGQWEEARVQWQSIFSWAHRAPARLRLGRAADALGDVDAALEEYGSFLLMWEEADPSLPPVVEAREAMARLGG